MNRSGTFMKIGLVTLGIVLCLSLSEVQAESRFESGFRGIPWGTHKNQLPDLGQSKKSLNKIYKSGPSSVLFMQGKGNLALDLDGIPLLSIFMQFDNQVFRGVDLIFNNANREKIYTILKQELGSEGSTESEETQWQTANVSILLTDRELIVSHRPL